MSDCESDLSYESVVIHDGDNVDNIDKPVNVDNGDNVAKPVNHEPDTDPKDNSQQNTDADQDYIVNTLNEMHRLCVKIKAINLDKYRNKTFIVRSMNRDNARFASLHGEMAKVSDPTLAMLIKEMKTLYDTRYTSLKSQIKLKFV